MEERTTFTDVINLLATKNRIKIPIKSEKNLILDPNDNLSRTLSYLDKSYSQKIWRHNNDRTKPKSKYFITDFKTSLLATVDLLYGYSPSNPNNSKLDINPNLLNLKSYVLTDDELILEYDINNLNNLHEILLFSPRSIDNNPEKILFIFLQLIKFYKYLNLINLNCAELKLSDIYIDQNYWIKIKLPFELILKQYAAGLDESLTDKLESSKLVSINSKIPFITTNSETLDSNDDSFEEYQEASFRFYSFKENLLDTYNSYKSLNHKELASITKYWCENKISNFDYLLILNCLSGREIDCAYNHPIFPWISDFESLNTNLRDLNLSKFRLNKGDAHLDLTYQASANNETGPYHLTEFLSEITYYVYKARITDKEILCKYVRRNWVANEYPNSIRRIYEWTPEECIPEFYCDASIFSSIHDDLPDLKVPDWCNGSVEDFIRTHRLLLESDLVSKKLHNWIDLVFGYKLTGDAAIEAKNVCLPLVDNHQMMQPYGVVQLFNVPHPYKITDKYYHSKEPPKIINRSRLRADNSEDSLVKVKYSSFFSNTSETDISKKKAGTKTDSTFDQLNSTIQIPDDYNPFLILDQMESLLKFSSRTYHCLPDTNLEENEENSPSFEDLTNLDMRCLACILAEIVYFSKLKCQPQQNSLEQRYSFICKAIVQEPHIVSGPFALFIASVLKPFGDLANEKHQQQQQQQQQQPQQQNKKITRMTSSNFYENILKNQSNYVTIETLLNPHLTILPFKPYFETLHKFSELFNKIDYLIREFYDLRQSSVQTQLANILNQIQSNTSRHSLAKTDSQTNNSNVIATNNNNYNYNNNNRTSTLRTQTVSTIVQEDENRSKYTKEDSSLPTIYFNEDDDFLCKSSKSVQTVVYSTRPDDTAADKAYINNEQMGNYDTILQTANFDDDQSTFVSLEILCEHKFQIAMHYLPNLMLDMSDQRKNLSIQSVCFSNDSFDLILPYLLNLFASPHTCVDSFLYLFSKLARFLSHSDLTKKFLPLILDALNVFDLNETIGIDLIKDDEKFKFCKLFEYSFIKDLRIIFGLEIFLVQICPFLIEAISGFKDFEYDTELTLSNTEDTNSFTTNQQTTNVDDLKNLTNPSTTGGLSQRSFSFKMAPNQNVLNNDRSKSFVEATNKDFTDYQLCQLKLSSNTKQTATATTTTTANTSSPLQSKISKKRSFSKIFSAADQQNTIFDMESSTTMTITNPNELKIVDEQDENEEVYSLSSKSTTKNNSREILNSQQSVITGRGVPITDFPETTTNTNTTANNTRVVASNSLKFGQQLISMIRPNSSRANSSNDDNDIFNNSISSLSSSKTNTITATNKLSKYSSVPVDLNNRKYIDLNELIANRKHDEPIEPASLLTADNNSAVFEFDRASLNSSNLNQNSKQVNVSTTAFDTFTKMISSLGPVLTCKYCCIDLLKMLAVCYMNNKCLILIETNENPLNSIRPIEGDRFAYLILESLKYVASLYGEQVIVLQYFTFVSNTVSASANRLTIRLEASLLAGVVLVNYFVSYLDIKLLMDNLHVHKNLRIGPELTRIELATTLKAYFNAFSLVRPNVMNSSSPSKPLKIERINSNATLSTKNSSYSKQSRNAFKARASIAFASFSHHQRAIQNIKENVLLASSIGTNNGELMKDLDDENSIDEYLKFSYDQSTHEIIGSSLNPNSALNGNNNNSNSNTSNNNKRMSIANATNIPYKFRSQSIGLLSLNNEVLENEPNDKNTFEMNSESPNSIMSSSYTNEIEIKIQRSLTIQGDEEILNAFTSELAHAAYYSISRLNSGVYIDSILSNVNLIHEMCLLEEQSLKKQQQQQQQQLQIPKNSLTMKNPRKSLNNEQITNVINRTSLASGGSGIGGNGGGVGGYNENSSSSQAIYSSSYGSSFSENIGVVGNQIQINEQQQPQQQITSDQFDINSSSSLLLRNLNDLNTPIGNRFLIKFSEQELKENKSHIDSSRHLNENWLAYWENEIRINNKSALFDFKHINLLTLSGHSSAVKCLLALDNEISIISGSKDKTVKLWTIRNQTGITSANTKKNSQTCQWTYTQHKKPVFNLVFIESMRACASCDGSVHVWDPFIGKKLFQLDNQIATCISSLPAPASSFIVATTDNVARFVDLRLKSYAYEFRTCLSPSGTIKSIATVDNLLLVGFSSGLMSLLDMRNGWIVESWKSHDNEILQLKFLKNHQFVSTYNDGSISISLLKDKAQLKNMIKVYNEPVPYLSVNDNQIITATNSNKIGIHSNINTQNQITFSLNKLQPDNFRGVISSQTYLPLNRLLLLGSDNGDIKLLC